MPKSRQIDLELTEIQTFYHDLFSELKAEMNNENFIQFILSICKDLSYGLDIDVDDIRKHIANEKFCELKKFGAIESLKRGIQYLAEDIYFKSIRNPDWLYMSGRLELQRLKLIVPATFEEYLNIDKNIWTNDEYDFYSFCMDHLHELEDMLKEKSKNDYNFTYFGLKTLEQNYLLKYILNEKEQKILETPQRMYLRVAIFLFMPDIDRIREFFYYLSDGLYTHASPTLFNAGVKKGSLASCYLLSMDDDLKHIYKQITNSALISKATGGIGMDVTNLRHSQIGNKGMSNGIVPMLRVFNETLRYANQLGKRKGAGTVFLQPWHIDVWEFLQCKRPHGKEEMRARDLFYCIYSVDLFMKRVYNNEMWSLFCPKKAPKLKDTFGEEFEKYYIQYEKEGVYSKQIPARKLLEEIIDVQREVAMPFLAHKDTINYTSNQKNLGLIRSSNLCMEIVEITDKETISSCNLASIALDEYIKYNENNEPYYDFELLGHISRKVVRALNHVIDRNYYPLGEVDENGKTIQDCPIKKTNLKYRPLGIGVQGLADAFMKMRYSWESQEAKQLNKDIFATIYYHCIEESVEMAKETGSYIGFNGSPASYGLLKPDLIARERARKELYLKNIHSDHPNYTIMMNERTNEILKSTLSSMYNWDKLRENVKRHGMKNSLLVALMPTASSAQIRYKTEAFEPIFSNLYIRTVLSGTHIIINRKMVEDFKKLGMWNNRFINNLLKHNGSVQFIEKDSLDENTREQVNHIQSIYKTAFELPQKVIMDMSIDRAFYVCQSQSLNIFMENPQAKQLFAMHFHGWKNALSTGMYYLRMKPARNPVQFTVQEDDEDDELFEKIETKNTLVCTDDVCYACST